MPDALLTLFVAHFACTITAEARTLSAEEVAQCSAVYHEIKLSFVPDIDAGAYQTLSPTEKAAANREGYLAFVAWRTANPDLVTHLEEVARGEATLAAAL